MEAGYVFCLLLIVAAACYTGSAKRIGLDGFTNDGFKVDLIHPASPSLKSSKNLSLTERIQNLVAKSHARAAWIAKASSGARPTDAYESPLKPDGGAYLMEFTVGTPAQKFTAIADTGSDLVWVQSDPCTSCSGAVYHSTKSSTYKAVQCSTSMCDQLPKATCGSQASCEYFYQYGSGETIGILGQDTVTLATTTGDSQKFPSFTVGRGIDNEGFHGFEGLVGLGQGPLSLTSQLGKAISNKFSYCLVDLLSASSSSPLYFGSAAELKGSGVQSTPIVKSTEFDTYYLVTVSGMTVAGTKMGSPGSTIVDSGTTLTYVPSSMYSDIKSAFSKLITLPTADGSKIGLDLCYDTSSNKNYKFPSMTIQYDGATMTPPSGNYFLAIDEAGDTTCLAMGDSNGFPVSIIGNVMQQGYHILYDRGTSTFSFVEEDCKSLK